MMMPGTLETSRYASLRKGGKVLGRLALWVQLGLLILGAGLFLDQAKDLLSDAQFTWGERRVMGIIAIVTLGGCGLSGWILGQLFRVSAQVLDVLADSAEAAWRTGDLIEQHLVPTLGRIALAIEERDGPLAGRSATSASTANTSVNSMRSELAAAQAAGRAGRVMELRDVLTQHLRGEPLHSLDRGLAIWMLNLVERRVQAGTVDAELAGWVARALDSFGSMSEAEPLRVALPSLRHRAGLCQKCGRPTRGQEALCADCRAGGAASRAVPGSSTRSSSTREALMSMRVRCSSCQTAFLTDVEEPGATVECPKCGAHHRLPAPSRPVDTPAPQTAPSAEPIPSAPVSSTSVFVPSTESRARSSRRLWMAGLAVLAILVLGGVTALVVWPRLKPRRLDPVERVANEYLQALVKGDETAQRRWSTVEEPPAIRSFQTIRRDPGRNRTVKGSYAPLARLHSKIDSEFTYDPAIGRFTPKNPLGAAGETLDAVQAAKEKAEKSGIYDKMASGDPNEIFDAAENFGKMLSQLSEGALAPKKILPTYKLLVNDAKPPLPAEPKELATHVADNPKSWDALLKRPFHTLKADGPFIFERAEVDTQVHDQLGSSGDPPTTLRLSLVRFRLEGIDTGWRIIAAKRILPGATDEPPSEPQPESPGYVSPSVPPPTAEPPQSSFSGKSVEFPRHTMSFPVESIADFPGRLAQLVRAPALHAGSRGFESLIAQSSNPCGNGGGHDHATENPRFRAGVLTAILSWAGRETAAND